jgi:hypothetical protein
MQRSLPEVLSELAAKYRALLRLREESEALEARGIFRLEGDELRARHSRTRALATQFPGALRELDCLDARGMAARLADVEAELEEARRAPERKHPQRSWVGVMIDFHTELHAALRIKRWLRQHRGSTDLTTLRAALEKTGGAPRRIDLRAYRELSVLEVVWRRLARRHRRSAAALKQLVFP